MDANPRESRAALLSTNELGVGTEVLAPKLNPPAQGAILKTHLTFCIFTKQQER
jgi:hypothetical protein